MKKLILCIVLLCSVSASAQQCPDRADNTTNPNNPEDYRGNNDGYDNTPPDTPDPNYVPLLLNPFLNRMPSNNGPKFNWVTPNLFEWHKPPSTGVSSVMIDNPFNPREHWENVEHLKNNASFRDNKPEDGWELIIYGLGQDRQLETLSSFSHPYVVLYNKYTGILRVFYYLRSSNFSLDYDAISIKLSFTGDDITPRNESANFSHMEEVAHPVDNFVKRQNLQVPNTIYNGLDPLSQGAGMWMHADFAMAYDPCVCRHDYNEMRVDIMLTDTADVELTGDITAKPIEKVGGTTSGTANIGADYKTGFKTADKFASQAQKSYKKSEELTAFMLKIAKKKLPENKQEDAEKQIVTEGLTKITELGESVPYVGMAIGIVNLLIKEEDAPTKPNNTPITFDATVKLSGTITNQANSSPIIFKVPGSNYVPYTSNPNLSNPTIPELIPFYDEPLGVISLVNTPRIEYRQNIAADVDDNGEFVPHNTSGPPWWENFPMVTTFTVKDPLEIALNPSSELEVVDIKVSTFLEYVPYDELKAHQNRLDVGGNFLNYPYTPGAQMTHHNHRPSHQWVTDWTHEDWTLADNPRTNLELQQSDTMYKISYGQMPIGCYENSKFSLISNLRKGDNAIPPGGQPNTENWVWEIPKIVIRLNMTLKHPTTGEHYKFIHSYLVKQEEITESEEPIGYYGINRLERTSSEKGGYVQQTRFQLLPIVGGTGWANDYTNSPGAADNLVLQNQEIGPGRIEAWDKIIILENVDIKDGTELFAGTEIIARSENTFNPEVSMKIGRSVDTEVCASTPIDTYFPDASDLTTFCDGLLPNTYNPVAAKKDFFKNEDDKEKEQFYNFNLYPNPTDDLVNVEVELVDGATYTLEVLDLSGRAVYNRTLSSAEFTNSTLAINTSSFESGIYFVNVTEGENRMTKRLVITR